LGMIFPDARSAVGTTLESVAPTYGAPNSQPRYFGVR
jgi:hypothetical protein